MRVGCGKKRCVNGRRALRKRPAGNFQKGDGLQGRYGGAWPVWKTVPDVRHAGAANRARRARGQLLSLLSDRGETACRPFLVEVVEGRLAAAARRARAPARKVASAGIARRPFGTF